MKTCWAWLLAILTLLAAAPAGAEYVSFYSANRQEAVEAWQPARGVVPAGGSVMPAGGSVMPAGAFAPMPLMQPPAAWPVQQAAYAQPPGYAPQGVPANYTDPACGIAVDPGCGLPGAAGGAGGGAGHYPVGHLFGKLLGGQLGAAGGLGAGGLGAGGGFGAGGGLGAGFGPYNDGYCGPRWYDVHAEYVHLWRLDQTSGEAISSDGIRGFGPPNVVLSTGDIGTDDAPGVRVVGRYEVGAASNLELGYLGAFNWSGSAQAVSNNNNLFSVFSDFGNDPFQGFLETGQATLHRIEDESELNSLELNWRRTWVSPGLRYHGSWLMGVRWVRYEEDFRFFSQVLAHDVPDGMGGTTTRGPASLDYNVDAKNDLVGFQLGGDIWACLVPGLMMGGELKAGIYGNDASQQTVAIGSTPFGNTNEQASGDDAAFVLDGGASLVYQVTPAITIRGGYTFLYMSGVALGTENFNSMADPSLFLSGNRIVSINDNGEVLVHGATCGAEWTW